MTLQVQTVYKVGENAARDLCALALHWQREFGAWSPFHEYMWIAEIMAIEALTA